MITELLHGPLRQTGERVILTLGQLGIYQKLSFKNCRVGSDKRTKPCVAFNLHLAGAATASPPRLRLLYVLFVFIQQNHNFTSNALMAYPHHLRLHTVSKTGIVGIKIFISSSNVKWNHNYTGTKVLEGFGSKE